MKLLSPVVIVSGIFVNTIIIGMLITMTHDIALSTALGILAFTYMSSLLLLVAASSICLTLVFPRDNSVDAVAKQYKWKVKMVKNNSDINPIIAGQYISKVP